MPRSSNGSRPSRRREGVGVSLLRAWFSATSRFAPEFAERQAATLFLTPRRRARREPVASGLQAQRLTLRPEGRALAAWSWGDGPTVLLVHGWSGRAADMSPLAAGLARAGYRAVAVDMPAHGYSSGRRTSLAEWMRLLPAIAQEIRSGAEPLHAMVGHSLGAAGIALAAEAGLPVRSAVLLAPPRGPIPFVERVRQYIGLPDARVAGMKRRLVEMVGRELEFFDAARAAHRIDVPALILHDPEDDEVPFDHAEAIARAWRRSRLERADGLGHYAILKSPATVVQVIRFVQESDPRMTPAPELVVRKTHRLRMVTH